MNNICILKIKPNKLKKKIRYIIKFINQKEKNITYGEFSENSFPKQLSFKNTVFYCKSLPVKFRSFKWIINTEFNEIYVIIFKNLPNEINILINSYL